jgi:hypothetical protein
MFVFIVNKYLIRNNSSTKNIRSVKTFVESNTIEVHWPWSDEWYVEVMQFVYTSLSWDKQIEELIITVLNIIFSQWSSFIRLSMDWYLAWWKGSFSLSNLIIYGGLIA